jgi:hypothetical protein
VLQCTAAVSSQMTALNNNFNYHFQQLQQQQQPPHQEQQQQPIPPPAPPAPPTTPPHNNDNNQRGDDEADEDMEEDLEEEGDLQEEDDGEAGADRVVLPHMEVQERLRQTPRQPDIGPRLPRSWLLVVEEWESLSLAAFLTANRRLWTGSDIRCRYHKRHTAIQEVERRRGQGQQRDTTLFDVAAELDEERNLLGLTACRHLDYLRSRNPGVGRRARAGQFLGVAERADIMGPPPAGRRPPRQRPRRAPLRQQQLVAQQQHQRLPTIVQPRIGVGGFRAGEQGVRMAAALQLEARDGAQQRAARYHRAVGNNAALLDEANMEALRGIGNGEDQQPS